MQDPESFQEYRADQVAVIDGSHPAGQTFISRRPGLNQVTLWLQADNNFSPPGANLTVDLFHEPGEEKPLASKVFPLTSLTKSNQLNIPLPPQKDGINQEYYIRLFVNDGRVIVFGRSEDSYPAGQLYVDDQPVGADVSFRLSYDYNWKSVLEDLGDWFNHAWLALPLILLLVLPGRLALQLSGLDRHFDWGARTGTSIGLSISLIPLIILWTSSIGFHWNRFSILTLTLVLAISYLWLIAHDYFIKKKNWQHSVREILSKNVNYTQIALAGIFIFSLAIRLIMVRDLAAPAWVDSVHHAMLSRLIIDQGSFPSSYAPYLDIASSNYHPGFHSLVAYFVWLSGQELSQAMLLLGQVLNATIIFSVYVLTIALTKSQLSGIFAALIAGLASPMPAYYTSWGRYTQLTGLLVLPVVFIFVKNLLDIRPAFPFKAAIDLRKVLKIFTLASISMAGLFIVHYRVSAYLLCLLIAYLLVQLCIDIWHRRFRRSLAWYLSTLIPVSLVSILLTLPWWPPTFRSLILPALSIPVPKLSNPVQTFADFSWSYLNTALGLYVLGLAGLGFIWSLVRRQTFGLVILLWVVILFLLANLRLFLLPGSIMFNNTSIAIMFFMPASVLGGYLLGWIVEGWSLFIPTRWRLVYSISWVVLTFGIMFVAARSLLPILNPVTFLFREADHPAMEWIEKNIPEGETIAINPFNWGYGLYAGSDGGFWITPLARRRSFPPPILYGMDYSSGTVGEQSDKYHRLLDLGSKPVELHQFLASNGVNYLYIGNRGGALSPQAISSHPELFKLLYQVDGVFIFELLQ